MKTSSILKAVGAVVVAAAVIVGILALNGVFTPESSDNAPEEIKSDTGLTGGVAATVNGTNIDEDKVTRAINNMRINYGYTEDDKWKEYLEKQKYTVESMRYEVLGQLIDQEIVKQCAVKLDISTNDEEVDSYVKKMEEQYSSEDAWLKAVEDAGWESLDKYKETLYYNILQKKIEEKFDGEVEAELGDEAKLVAKAQENKASYSGAKRTARILFSKEEEDIANEVHDKITKGEMSFEDAVKEYSKDDDTKDKGGDMGWNMIDSPTTEYTEAITELQLGGISKPTTDRDGISIITVTEVWEAPETITQTSEVPEAILAKIKTNAIDTDGNDRYDKWLKGQRPENDVQVNDMPSDVPYWVDMNGVYSEDEAQKINKKALNLLITGVEEEEQTATDAEAAADASSTPAS